MIKSEAEREVVLEEYRKYARGRKVTDLNLKASESLLNLVEKIAQHNIVSQQTIIDKNLEKRKFIHTVDTIQ